MSSLRPFRLKACLAASAAALLLLTPVAQEHDIPLFDRFAIMRQWNDQGQFDLFSPSRGPELAKQVHDCLGRALAQFVIDAAHLGPAQQQN